MTGINSSVNNAIHAVRRGGDVILFGLKSGDAVDRELRPAHRRRHQPAQRHRPPHLRDLAHHPAPARVARPEHPRPDLGGHPEPRRGDDVRLRRLRRRRLPEGDLDVPQGRDPVLSTVPWKSGTRVPEPRDRKGARGAREDEDRRPCVPCALAVLWSLGLRRRIERGRPARLLSYHQTAHRNPRFENRAPGG